MAMPIGAIRRPVTIVDCAGQEVGITDGALDVNATINVPGDTPNMFTAQQDLGAGAMDETDAINLAKMVLWFGLHLDAPLVANQTLSIYLDSADGAAFDTLILQETLVAGTTDKFFSWPCNTLLRLGDHIRYVLTDTGGAETAIASLSAMYGT